MDNHIMCYGTIGTCQSATTSEIVERCLDWFLDLLVLIFVFLKLFIMHPECWNIRSQDRSFPGPFVPKTEYYAENSMMYCYNRSNTSFIVYVK